MNTKRGDNPEKLDKFNDAVMELVENHLEGLNILDMADILINIAKYASACHVGCYHHLLGILTQALTEGLQDLFDQVQCIQEIKKLPKAKKQREN